MSTGIAIRPSMFPSPVLGAQTDAGAPSVARAQMISLVQLRSAIRYEQAETPAASSAASQIRSELSKVTAGPLTPDAISRLAAAIEAEERRRQDGAAARKTLLEGIERLMVAYEKDYPREALDVWTDYGKWMDTCHDKITVLDAEMKETADRVKKLKDNLEKKDAPAAPAAPAPAPPAPPPAGPDPV